VRSSVIVHEPLSVMTGSVVSTIWTVLLAVPVWNPSLYRYSTRYVHNVPVSTVPLIFATPVSPLSSRTAPSSVYHENTSSVIVEVPFSVIVGVVVSIKNVAQVEFHAKSLTTKTFVHSFVIGSPLAYGAPFMVAHDMFASENVIAMPVS